MHLKSLRLQGFKTFARRTELPFSRGITAIVGPNGSGKSNLVDAIRWALGERNARGLRGHRMEDVIYSGGPGKSAVGMAEVTLTIDNADQRLNVEFTEIEVARRLFRSGESEYLVNGARARLKDIDALLASTGLRQDGYAVTAQNDIDFVIQAAPAVRRELIEEAAGVRRLRDQREEALNRLAEAERDMRRARDILNELTPRADELRGQAVAAEEYQKVAAALKVLQGSLARDAWRKAMVQLRRAVTRQHATEEKRSDAAKAAAEFEPRYAEHRVALHAAREARWRHQEAVAELRLHLSESQHQARIAEERRVAAVQALAAAQLEIDRLLASEQAGGRVVDELSRAVEGTRLELDGAQAALDAAVEHEAHARETHVSREGDRTGLQQRRQELHRERSAVEAEVRQLEGRMQFLHEQQQQARAQLDAWAARHASSALDLESRRRASAVADGEVATATAAAAAGAERITAVQASLAQAERAVAEHDARVRVLEADIGALRTLRDRAQRHGSAPDEGHWARLLELIDVDVEHRAAVEAALEGWLHAIVPDDGDRFETTVASLAQSEDARETVLMPRIDVPLTKIPDGLLALSSLVDAPPAIAVPLAFLLGDAVFATDREEARRITLDHPHLRVVTPAGEVVTAVSYRGGRAGEAPLEIQSQLRRTEEAADRERAALDEVREELERTAAARGSLIDEQTGVTARLDAARAAAAQAAGALSAARDAVQREEQQQHQVRQQLDRVAGLLEQAEQAQVAAAERQRAAIDDDANLMRAAAQVEESIRESAAAQAAATQARQDAELRAALARQRSDDLLRQLERANIVWRANGNELTQRRAASESLLRQPALLEQERIQWIGEADRLRAELASLESAQLPDAASLTQFEEQVRTDEQHNVGLQVEMAHADDGWSAAIAERDAAQAEVDRCAQALREDGHVVEDEAEPIEEVDWQKTEREVSRLQRRLESMGAVNLLAPEEYAQVKDRCDSLGSQLADLEAATAQLIALRQRLEEEIDARFRTVFQSVAINFQEFFGELFEGGRATLRMDSQPEGNPLDEGVEILAQTPGKRLQPLTLLSGGERALTALAFLFALQAVNPSPFYVLDEVDAALDDANVVRFNRVLKRLAADQQFLIVTHNHSTMGQAEVLYGVTLGEHGISRIVSVRLQQDTLMPVGERTA